jgi:hypothetical protein
MVIELQKMDTTNEEENKLLHSPPIKMKKKKSSSSKRSLISRKDSSLKHSSSIKFDRMITTIGQGIHMNGDSIRKENE